MREEREEDDICLLVFFFLSFFLTRGFSFIIFFLEKAEHEAKAKKLAKQIEDIKATHAELKGTIKSKEQQMVRCVCVCVFFKVMKKKKFLQSGVFGCFFPQPFFSWTGSSATAN